MSWIAPVAAALGGSLLTGKDAKQAAQSSSQAQSDLTNQMFDKAVADRNAQATALRGAITGLGQNPFMAALSKIHPSRTPYNTRGFGATNVPMYGTSGSGGPPIAALGGGTGGAPGGAPPAGAAAAPGVRTITQGPGEIRRNPPEGPGFDFSNAGGPANGPPAPGPAPAPVPPAVPVGQPVTRPEPIDPTATPPGPDGAPLPIMRRRLGGGNAFLARLRALGPAPQ